MQLRNRTTGAVIDFATLKLDHPNVSFPQMPTDETFADFDLDIIRNVYPEPIPNRQHTADGIEQRPDGKWYVKYTLQPIQPHQIEAERDRRLSLGFTYDFGDERGAHFIATTREDNDKWREVTDIANAAINAGLPATAISIKTGTGQVSVTAAEWQMILLHAGQVRQQIYQAYFALRAMEPFPDDFADDSWWQ